MSAGSGCAPYGVASRRRRCLARFEGRRRYPHCPHDLLILSRYHPFINFRARWLRSAPPDDSTGAPKIHAIEATLLR